MTVNITFAEEYDTDYVDWASQSEIPFDSYLISGYKVYGQGDKPFQSNYVTISYGEGNGELSDQGALFRGVWDTSLYVDSNRWGSQQEIVNPNIDPEMYAYGARKLKVRGHGKFLQFRIDSEDGLPFYINGWTVFVTANQVP